MGWSATIDRIKLYYSLKIYYYEKVSTNSFDGHYQYAVDVECAVYCDIRDRDFLDYNRR